MNRSTSKPETPNSPPRRPLWRRHVRIVAGFATLLVGIVLALPLVPGPGIPLILLGLVLLSDHFAWARRLLAWAKQKWSEADARVRGGAATGNGPGKSAS